VDQPRDYWSDLEHHVSASQSGSWRETPADTQLQLKLILEESTRMSVY